MTHGRDNENVIKIYNFLFLSLSLSQLLTLLTLWLSHLCKIPLLCIFIVTERQTKRKIRKKCEKKHKENKITKKREKVRKSEAGKYIANECALFRSIVESRQCKTISNDAEVPNTSHIFFYFLSFIFLQYFAHPHLAFGVWLLGGLAFFRRFVFDWVR